jgi:hypothetical protein
MNETAYRDGGRVIQFFLYCGEIKTYGRALAALRDPAAWPCVFIDGKCVRDSRENPDKGRRGTGPKLHRIIRGHLDIKIVSGMIKEIKVKKVSL